MDRSPFGEIDGFVCRRSLSSLAALLFSTRRSLQSNLLESLHVIAQITEIDSAPSFAAFDAGKIDA